MGSSWTMRRTMLMVTPCSFRPCRTSLTFTTTLRRWISISPGWSPTGGSAVSPPCRRARDCSPSPSSELGVPSGTKPACCDMFLAIGGGAGTACSCQCRQKFGMASRRRSEWQLMVLRGTGKRRTECGLNVRESIVKTREPRL